MPLVRKFCKNHLDVPAKRRCYHCQQYICADCQILAKHHYFCSLPCYYAHFKIAIPEPVVKPRIEISSKPVGSVKTFSKFWQRISWSGAAILLLAVLLVMLMKLNLDFQKRLRAFEEILQTAGYSQRPQHLDFSKKLPLSVFKPVNHGMVLSNRIDIEGEAADNQIISLVVDGEIRAVTLPQNGKFQFLGISVKRGDNGFIIRAISKSGEVTELQTLNFAYASPTLGHLSKNISRGDPLVPNVALTFDGGSVANAADEILDILAAKQVKCTFFLTGEFIQKFPDIVRRMLEAGHEIGNHTKSHPHLTTFAENRLHLTRPEVTREFLHRELNETAAVLQAVTGRAFAPYWRAPFGEHNLEIRGWAAELGYRHIGWTFGQNSYDNLDTMDWVADTTSAAYHSANEIVEKILSFGNGSAAGANGAIIIMHLGTLRSQDFPHKKLPQIIDGLRERGYQLVPVSELIE